MITPTSQAITYQYSLAGPTTSDQITRTVVAPVQCSVCLREHDGGAGRGELRAIEGVDQERPAAAARLRQGLRPQESRASRVLRGRLLPLQRLRQQKEHRVEPRL